MTSIKVDEFCYAEKISAFLKLLSSLHFQSQDTAIFSGLKDFSINTKEPNTSDKIYAQHNREPTI